MALAFKFSRGGTIAAGSLLLSFISVFAWIFFVASKNPADSGESGILLLPFAMPWISWVPDAWLGLMVAVGCVLLNALILYCIFGGLRMTRSTDSR
jgi:hypothetical protein